MSNESIEQTLDSVMKDLDASPFHILDYTQKDSKNFVDRTLLLAIMAKCEDFLLKKPSQTAIPGHSDDYGSLADIAFGHAQHARARGDEPSACELFQQVVAYQLLTNNPWKVTDFVSNIATEAEIFPVITPENLLA